MRFVWEIVAFLAVVALIVGGVSVAYEKSIPAPVSQESPPPNDAAIVPPVASTQTEGHEDATATEGESWPAVPPAYVEVVQAALEEYERQNRDWRRWKVDEHLPAGNYLNYNETVRFREGGRVTLDEQGIPMVAYDGVPRYNPVTVSQHLLAVHARHLSGEGEFGEFLNGTDLLLSLQSPDGAFRYDFAWRYYLTGETYQPGWVSGMAQGQALSVLARAYDLTHDEKYAEAARSALSFLLVPTSEGGTTGNLSGLDPSLSSYVMYDEYIAFPSSVTLNGFLFTLLGIYDWSQVATEAADRQAAEDAFDDGLRTLVMILPYYDMGGFTAYDLGHMTHGRTSPHVGPGYHAVHIYLLHALDTVTEQPIFTETVGKWAAYVNQ